MNFFILFLSICVVLNAVSCFTDSPSSTPQQSIFHINWITHQTKWPVVLGKDHTDMSPADYDWFRFDKQTFVTQMPNYKPNYFVSKEKKKSELSIFTYDTKTHEPLATYEPIQMTKFENEPASDKLIEFYQLVFLKSHHLQITRDEQNTGANITCIADFLVDQKTIEMNPDLVEEMKNLALFRVDLEEPTQGDIKQFKKKLYRKKMMQDKLYNKLTRNAGKIDTSNIKRFREKRTINDRLKRNEALNQEKMIMNIRLSFGPIYIPQPINERLISCSLDLVNLQTVQLEYQNKVFKFLSKENIGLDTILDRSEIPKNMIESTETVPTPTMNRPVPEITITTEKTTTTTKSFMDMSDREINNIFKAEETLERLEQDIIKKSGVKNFEKMAEKLGELVEEELIEKKHDRRFFEMDNSLLTFIDEPVKLSFNSAPRSMVNFSVLVITALLSAILFY